MSRSQSPSPPAKRVKLDEEDNVNEDHDMPGDDGDSGDNCSICLHDIVDRTVIPTCSHEFCFECLLVWTEQSRRCPLCTQAVGEYLIHDIRSKYDYRKHYLSPLRSSPPPQSTSRGPQDRVFRRRRRAREWGRREGADRDESDRLDRSLEKRRWIYAHDLYAKHVASNPYTKYRPYPTPPQFAASQEFISRTTAFLRRELRVWENMDVEFLTTFIISMMKAIDIRSESAIKLLAEFLDMDTPYVAGGRYPNAEHFAHEVYCYVRSPYKDLFVYDNLVQYDIPAGVEPPSERTQPHRWRGRDNSHSPAASHEGVSRRPQSPSSSGSPPRYTRSSILEEHPDRHNGISTQHRPSSSEALEASDYHAVSGVITTRHSINSTPQVLNADDDDKERSVFGNIRPEHDSFPVPNGERVVPNEIGKGRVDEGLSNSRVNSVSALDGPPPTVSPAEEQEDTKVATSSQALHSRAALSVADKRKPRSRNLLDSVHAHLTLPTRTLSAKSRQKQPETSPVIQRNPDARSSLLQRLSNPDGPPVERRVSHPQEHAHTAMNNVTTDATNIPRNRTMHAAPTIQTTRNHVARQSGADPELTLTTRSPSHSIVTASGASFPLESVQDASIMSITPPTCSGVFRTSSATLGEIDSASRPYARGGSPENGPMVCVKQLIEGAVHVSSDSNALPIDISIGTGDSISSDSIHQTSPSLWDSRTRLLSRLEQEKQEAVSRSSLVSRFAAIATSSGQATVSSGLPDIPPMEALQIEDGQIREARLRRQALLRMKVATLKRQMEGDKTNN